ncbi:exported hypothetical protein [Frankia canadensis]|uniref:Secreted protein n=1 Tax=Frankia canadensis TaxID=1836972 RepID=A0A2I2KZT8_9ACTN|nr:exported hypothetical protein [Frankia canadensis]SOU58459.1 exported hypothetical protein [Frankia canadensis]
MSAAPTASGLRSARPLFSGMLIAAVTSSDAAPAMAPSRSSWLPGRPQCPSAQIPTPTQPRAEPNSGSISRLCGATTLICCIERIADGAGARRNAGITRIENPNSTPPVIPDNAAVGSVTKRWNMSIVAPLLDPQLCNAVTLRRNGTVLR